MIRNRYIFPLKPRGKTPRRAGSKANNLRRLLKLDYLIPPTYFCSWDAYHDYLSDNPVLIAKLQVELANILNPQKTYAVRSSAKNASEMRAHS